MCKNRKRARTTSNDATLKLSPGALAVKEADHPDIQE